jgi:hypothetical protein
MIGRCSTELLHITVGGAEFSACNDWKMQHGVTALPALINADWGRVAAWRNLRNIYMRASEFTSSIGMACKRVKHSIILDWYDTIGETIEPDWPMEVLAIG